MKRSKPETRVQTRSSLTRENERIKREKLTVEPEHVNNWKKEFKNDAQNKILQNAVSFIGIENISVNNERVKQINHIFHYSLKEKEAYATNQHHTGRCWMFAGCNVFRHGLMRALNCYNFKFSTVYLFFWDKLERANSLLQWFIDNPTAKPGDRMTDWMMTFWMWTDGSWWANFANLVDKYGIIPEHAMSPTYQSEDSEDMNELIMENVILAIKHISEEKGKEEKINIKTQTLQNIYNILTKCLGTPPEHFDHSYHLVHSNETMTLSNLTPQTFRKLALLSSGLENINDLVTIAHAEHPDRPFYNKYQIGIPSLVANKSPITFINLPINEMMELVRVSLDKGLPVWFVGDVRRNFNNYYSALDPLLSERSITFRNQTNELDKTTRIQYKYLEGSHAMTITGYNVDDDDNITSYQVENSHGYIDPHRPGLDGFLWMSKEWFIECAFEIVVDKKILNREQLRVLNSDPVMIEPWDAIAPAVYVTGNYKISQ